MSLLVRLGSAATVAALATTGVMAASTAAGAATRPAKTTHIFIANKVVAHAGHRVDKITGFLRLLAKPRTPLAGEPVWLESRTGSKWVVVGTLPGTTDSTGHVTFLIGMPTKTTHYRMVFKGDSKLHYRPSLSNVITVFGPPRHKRK
ncbi:MAG TPA: hypothetical protein VNF47_04475 [Streptosporangiaceae bacterium]|nr:hypothetical protein [Streptosporangiaceae bacterium]